MASVGQDCRCSFCGRIADMSDVSPKSKRRFLRFSLRAMLLLVVVIALVMAWIGRELKLAKQQGIAVVALRDAGCEVADHSQISDDDNGGSRILLNRVQ